MIAPGSVIKGLCHSQYEVSYALNSLSHQQFGRYDRVIKRESFIGCERSFISIKLMWNSYLSSSLKTTSTKPSGFKVYLGPNPKDAVVGNYCLSSADEHAVEHRESCMPGLFMQGCIPSQVMPLCLRLFVDLHGIACSPAKAFLGFGTHVQTILNYTNLLWSRAPTP